MTQFLKFDPKIKFHITRPEDRFFQLVRKFITDFQQYHDEEKLGFEEAISRSLEMNASARVFLRIKNTPDGINLEVDDSLIYPYTGFIGYEVSNGTGGILKQIVSGEKNIVKVAEIFSRISTGTLTAGQIQELFLESKMNDLWNRLSEDGAFVPFTEKRFDFDRMGIHRLQHASILFHSGKTKVITDPNSHSYCTLKEITDLSFCDLPTVDAILITHYHRDHYDLSSLALFDRNTKIFFPKVKRATILCPDVETELRTLGFTNLFPLEDTYRPIKIGDFTLTPTPFRGEQATVDEEPYRHDVRNIGLTYLLECEGMRSWLLADSGKDWESDMVEEARVVRAKVGPLTHIFSNFREFNTVTPRYLDGGITWLTLSTEQKKKLPQGIKSLTLGVTGIARILEIFPEAAVFPYAHWWANYGESPSTDWEEIQELLPLVSDKTKIREWKIGDRIDYHQ